MAWTADRKQFVGFLVFVFNPLYGLLKKWSAAMPPGWEVLPYLVNFLIIAVAFYYMYFYASPQPKFSLWLIPVLVSVLAVITYLRW
jgi:hypothetical protein